MRLAADKDCLFCDFCGNIHVPDVNADGIRVLEEPADMACPVCAIPLIQAAVAGQRILYCKRCHGLLISMGVFMAIIHDLRSRHQTAADSARPPDWKDLNRRIKCPKCHQTMDTHPYGGGGNVIIDDCETCSLNWLDYSELDRIVRAPDHEYTGETWDAR